MIMSFINHLEGADERKVSLGQVRQAGNNYANKQKVVSDECTRNDK